MSDLIVAWPESRLPAPASSSYSIETAHSAARTTMDSGSIRQRRRFLRPKHVLNVMWQMTDEEYQFFQSWVMYVINGGSNWFSMNIPSGDGIETQKVRFQEGKYKGQYQGYMHWNVTAILDLDNTNMLNEETVFKQQEGKTIDEAVQSIANAMKAYYTKNWSA